MAPVQPPAAGSAVFDRAGHFVGLIGPMAKEPRRFAGVVPLMTHPLIALPRVLAFAAIAGTLPPAGQEGTDKPRSLGEIVSASRASLLGIECGK